MVSSEPKPLVAIGFLTVVEHEQHGFFGGYLVLNASGRPLEFHCTAPVKPNRAQEILYGPTLQPYLYGEQIGQTLISKCQTKPLAVCTDLPPVLAARDFVPLPIALVLGESGEENLAQPPAAAEGAVGRMRRFDSAHRPPELASFQLGRNHLAVASQYDQDRAELVDRLSTLADHFDLAEPFDRIRGAIEEAQRTGR